MAEATGNSSVGDNVSESDFLAEQAEKSMTAALEAIKDAKAALEKSLDPRPAMRQHPLFAIGLASLTGFVAALLTIPSKQDQEIQRLERLQRATNPEPGVSPASNGDAKTGGHTPPSSIWSSIVHEIVQLIRPILLTAITAGIKSATSPPAENSPSQNSNAPL